MEEVDRFRKALQEIALGRGPFKIDPLEHAQSVIEDMKNVATRALAGEVDEDWGIRP